MCYPMVTSAHGFEVVRREMFNRPVDEKRYRGLVRWDKTLRWALEQLALVEGRRKTGRRSMAALPKPLRELRPSAFAVRISETMTALRRNLIDGGHHEEALAVIDEHSPPTVTDPHRCRPGKPDTVGPCCCPGSAATRRRWSRRPRRWRRSVVGLNRLAALVSLSSSATR